MPTTMEHVAAAAAAAAARANDQPYEPQVQPYRLSYVPLYHFERMLDLMRNRHVVEEYYQQK